MPRRRRLFFCLFFVNFDFRVLLLQNMWDASIQVSLPAEYAMLSDLLDAMTLTFVEGLRLNDLQRHFRQQDGCRNTLRKTAVELLQRCKTELMIGGKGTSTSPTEGGDPLEWLRFLTITNNGDQGLGRIMLEHVMGLARVLHARCLSCGYHGKCWTHEVFHGDAPPLDTINVHLPANDAAFDLTTAISNQCTDFDFSLLPQAIQQRFYSTCTNEHNQDHGECRGGGSLTYSTSLHSEDQDGIPPQPFIIIRVLVLDASTSSLDMARRVIPSDLTLGGHTYRLTAVLYTYLLNARDQHYSIDVKMAEHFVYYDNKMAGVQYKETATPIKNWTMHDTERDFPVHEAWNVAGVVYQLQ